MSTETEAFFAKHAAGGANNIVAVIAERKPEGSDFAVFSTLDAARAWADTLCDDDYCGVVFVPYVIDVPEFGNVPKGAQQ